MIERQLGSRLREGFEAERGGHARQQLRNVAHVVDDLGIEYLEVQEWERMVDVNIKGVL